VKALFSLLNPPMSFVNVILCFIPFILIWWKKISSVNAFLFIGIYWLANALQNLPDCFGESENMVLQHRIIYFYNLLDAPLVLLIFYFGAVGRRKKIILYTLIFFLIFEPAVLIWKGHNHDSSTIVVGPDSLVGLIFSVWGLAGYFQEIEHTEFENAMVFAYAGFVFDYGVSIVTFVFSYLKYETGILREASLFVYYFSMILGAALTSYGLWRHARPRPSLSRI
jgi:hypothetical protein